ncbi:MAG: glycosyl hydrolase [Planctomycetes bacterium]|nr:glycosyl hydrolase [Planctomycetota bacterium]
MIHLNEKLTPADLLPKLDKFWHRSAECLDAIEATFPQGTATSPQGSATPVFTVEGQYTAQGWTEWTQGFQYGSLLLQFDATDEQRFFELGRQRTVDSMASHLTHVGVHDHGFNNVSTYGNLWRLMNEGRVPEDEWQRNFCELALKVTGAVQASRWAVTSDGTGYIYSFNGPQSLFVDTIRSCRALAISYQLGHALMGEQDLKISLLECLIEHSVNTARYNIWYGEGRDTYDIRGRTAHESIFNTAASGEYRCPSSQQGYSPFSTWTRGLAWAMLGFPEQLEWLATLPDEEFEVCGGRESVEALFLKAALATCDFYIEQTPTCGVPYWDTGAPGLAKLGDYLDRPAEPFNAFEPVDSSAAAIAAQGLLRLGQVLDVRGETASGARYRQAGLTVLDTLLDEPYLSTDSGHQGLLLHSIYHRPNGWDHIPAGQTIPCGESSMWGDYHARELALYVGRLAKEKPYYTFFGPNQ